MKKILFLIVILTIITIGCSNTNQSFKLKIKESSWSGWTENYEPDEVTNTYDVVLNKEYSIASSKFQFKIEEVNSDNIVITTKGLK